ncbi:MAG TPA: sensor histidine kinase [Thermodesulfobacteriota bacterium]|nr:sensor histidine kinase [Thermodesulfobacteriota bacterium]
MRELSLHVLDVIENALEAGASWIQVRIDEDLKADLLAIEIVDNGRGMSEELLHQVLNPFYTTRKTRHVGLGLPLFREAARRCDGELVIQSKPGKGTCVKATFRHSHIDRAPMGDIPTALLAALLCGQTVDLDYTHNVEGRTFQLKTAEIRKELGDIPLTYPKVRDWLFQELREGEASLHP